MLTFLFLYIFTLQVYAIRIHCSYVNGSKRAAINLYSPLNISQLCIQFELLLHCNEYIYLFYAKINECHNNQTTKYQRAKNENYEQNLKFLNVFCK